MGPCKSDDGHETGALLGERVGDLVAEIGCAKEREVQMLDRLIS